MMMMAMIKGNDGVCGINSVKIQVVKAYLQGSRNLSQALASL